jgi:O-antigen/teichoic acid export membrane protein
VNTPEPRSRPVPSHRDGLGNSHVPSVGRSVGAAVAGRLVAMLFQGVASIVLSQLLNAKDFGLVNFSSIVTGFVARLNDMGVEAAVVQRPTLGPRTLSTAFALKLATSALMTFALWLCAAPIAGMLGTPGATPVIRVLASTFVLSALAFVPMVSLRKRVRYDAIGKVWVTSTLFGSACSISLALLGAGYWSIVLGQVVSALAVFVAAQLLEPSSYSLLIDREDGYQLLTFGGRVFLSSLLAFACFNVDNLLIGVTLGASALGLYGLAFNWATQICTFTSGTVLSVLSPAFANLGTDRGSIRLLYESSIRTLGLFGAMAYGSLALGSREFLVLVLGRGTDKWIEALPVLQVLCVYGVVRLMVEPIANVLMALGRAELLLRAAGLVFVTESVGVCATLLSGGGITSVAVVVTVAYALQCVYLGAKLRDELELGAIPLAAMILPPIVVVGLITLAASQWRHEATWVAFALKSMLGATVAPALYLCLGGRKNFEFSWATKRPK